MPGPGLSAWLGRETPLASRGRSLKNFPQPSGTLAFRTPVVSWSGPERTTWSIRSPIWMLCSTTSMRGLGLRTSFQRRHEQLHYRHSRSESSRPEWLTQLTGDYVAEPGFPIATSADAAVMNEGHARLAVYCCQP